MMRLWAETNEMKQEEGVGACLIATMAGAGGSQASSVHSFGRSLRSVKASESII